MTLDAFLETAWNDHGDRPQEVADRIAASFHLITAAADLPPFVRLLTHVYGEHLGQWQRGVDLLQALRALPAYDGSAAVTGTLERASAALRYGGGDATILAGLSDEDRAHVLASAAAAFAGRNDFARAATAYSEALTAAAPGLPQGSPALRALAIGGNNLAAALEARAQRSAEETAAMLTAAQGGLTYWKLAGKWLEEERAHYQLARCRLAAGEAVAAAQSARQCIQVCERNNAPAFERFFGYAVFALAQRAAGNEQTYQAERERALRLLAEVPDDERKWCAREAGELEA